MVEINKSFDGDSMIFSSLQPNKKLDKEFLKTSRNIKDGVYSHDSFEGHYLVDQSVMNLYIETTERLITLRRQITG
jgi:hypothetical protein